jgi:hypothetical protein
MPHCRLRSTVAPQATWLLPPAVCPLPTPVVASEAVPPLQSGPGPVLATWELSATVYLPSVLLPVGLLMTVGPLLAHLNILRFRCYLKVQIVQCRWQSEWVGQIPTIINISLLRANVPPLGLGGAFASGAGSGRAALWEPHIHQWRMCAALVPWALRLDLPLPLTDILPTSY